MEHLIFFYFSIIIIILFLAFLQIWCLHSNPSRRLQVFYVLSMLSLLIGTHGCKLFMSVNLQILSSLSLFSPVLPPTLLDSHMHKTPHIESSVRFKCQSPLGT